MANPIAEAFVLLRPDLAGFPTEVQKQVSASVSKVRIGGAGGQALATQMFGTGNFQAATKTGITSAISRAASGGVVPTTAPRSIAQQLFGSSFRSETGRAFQGALSGLGLGQVAAESAFFGPGGAAIAVSAGALLLAAKNAATFEQSLNTLQAVAQLTDEQLAQFSETAKQLGADVTLPAVTAQSAADAFTELAKAGLSASDALAAGRGVLQLATAAGTDAATAAQITASALNAFALSGDKAVHVADLLAGASIAAQGDIGDMALALQQSATVANSAGLSIEQLTGLITELARRGLTGSDAGTSIRTALLRLIPTTKEAAQIMQVLGIQIDKTRTLGEQLPDLLDQYNAAFKRLSPTTRQSTLQQIAGTDAVRSLTIAIDEGSAGLQRSIDASNRQGAANDIATAKTKGLAGAVQGLNSTVQTLGINVGTLLIPPLTLLVTTLTDAIAPINDVFDALSQLKQIGDIDLNVRVNIPHIPDFNIPGADIGKTLVKQLNPALGLFGNLTSRARLLSAALREIGLTERASEFDKLADKAQKLNDELFAGGVTKPRAQEIQRELAALQKQMDDLAGSGKKAADGIRSAFSGPFADTFTPPITALENQLKNLAIDPNALGRQLQAAIRTLNDPSIGAEAKKVTTELATSLIGQLSKLGPDGERVLKAAGVRMMHGLADGITSEEQRAIDAARKTLSDVRAEGELQVQEAIRSARGNLESLGTTLGEDVAKLIDVGPIGQEIDKVNRALDALQERTSRRDLTFNTKKAREELRDAQASIIQVGVLTPAQKRRQGEFLEDFTKKVKDAKDAVKTFDLTKQRDELEKTREAAEKTANEGIQRLIDQFEAGQLSAGDFNAALSNRLGPALDTLKTKAGQNLGLVFTRDFKREVSALVAQAQALSAFFPLGGGTTPGATVVRPSDTQAQVNQRIAEAAASLAQILKDARTLSQEEQDKQTTTNAILRRILAAIATPVGPRPSHQ